MLLFKLKTVDGENMIKTPTLLILGAGASAPYGFPLGTELKANINKDLIYYIQKHPKNHWIKDLGISENSIVRFTSSLDSSTGYSIDSFLEHQNEEYIKIGKLSIVNQISKSESAEKLFHTEYVKDDGEIIKNDDHWYSYLINRIKSHSPVEAIKDNKLEIITFNYDRSLEMFFIVTLANFYSCKDYKESASLMQNFPILHMFGQLDHLPLEIPFPGKGKSKRIYEAHPSSEDIKKISKNIKLIHEAIEDKTVSRANEMIEKADRIYFLGLDLSNNKDNLELFDLSLFKGKDVLVTAFGLENEEKNQLKKYFKPHSLKTLVVSGSDMKSLKSIRSHMPLE